MPPNSSSDPAVAPSFPQSAGGSMRVEPSAIPNLVSALQSSLDSVGVQIEHAITELRIRPWAGDPVSATAADAFNQRSLAGGDNAIDALCGYRNQLQSAAESLQLANQQYQQADDDSVDALRGGC